MKKDWLQESVFRELFIARERGASVRELVSTVYAHCPEGGALTADRNVNKTIYSLKKKLAPHGATITADWGPCSRYRLVLS